MRPKDSICTVKITSDAMIEELIADVCRISGINAPPEHYYLIFEGHELDVGDTVRESGLLKLINTDAVDYPELRLKIQYQLNESSHLGTHVVLTSPEKLVYDEILEVPYKPTHEDIMPEILKPLVQQIHQRESQSSTFSSKLISMPVFTKQVIDQLPTVLITVCLKPNDFDWNELLQHLAMDLEVDKNDMFLMNAQEGSTKYEIKFKAAISLSKERMKKIAQKVVALILPTSKTSEFISKQKVSGDLKEVSKIEARLENLSENEDSVVPKKLTSDDIDTALELMQRPAIIDPLAWDFLSEKSRKLSTCILHAFQTSAIEYIIESMALIHNEELYEKYVNYIVPGEERILFHGTKAANFDGIFEQNFKNLHTTDSGWYGQGLYFSSSPRYCATYAGSFGSEVMYLICSLIKLGEVYSVKDMSYNGKPMHSNCNTHYVKVSASGSPTDAVDGFFEEFVIKESNQVLPLYIIGLRGVKRFVLWRDAKIADSHNSDLFVKMKQHYSFNIYGSETSAEALAILKCKLANWQMNCVIVTNGADNGEQFARDCRTVRSNIPIIVYCMSINYHQQWATAVSEHSSSKIQVTGDSDEIFTFIDANFPSGSD